MVCLFAFDARFFCLSAAQNAPPVGCPLAGGTFCAAGNEKNGASKVNKLTFGYKSSPGINSASFSSCLHKRAKALLGPRCGRAQRCKCLSNRSVGQ